MPETEPPNLTRGARLFAIRFITADEAKVTPRLKKGDHAGRGTYGNIVVPPDAAYGATMIFETSKGVIRRSPPAWWAGNGIA